MIGITGGGCALKGLVHLRNLDVLNIMARFAMTDVLGNWTHFSFWEVFKKLVFMNVAHFTERGVFYWKVRFSPLDVSDCGAHFLFLGVFKVNGALLARGCLEIHGTLIRAVGVYCIFDPLFCLWHLHRNGALSPKGSLVSGGSLFT